MQPLLSGLIAFSAIFIFQNCGRSNQSLANQRNIRINDSKTMSEEVISGAAGFTNISRYLDRNMMTGAHLVLINLKLGTVAYQAPTSKQYSKYCRLDVDREQRLKSLMATSQICRYSQLDHPDYVHCQAVGVRDLTISNDHGAIQDLTRPLCGEGEDLCGSSSDHLRDILDDLANNPPSGC